MIDGKKPALSCFMVAKRRRIRTVVEDRQIRFFCCPHKLRPASPSARAANKILEAVVNNRGELLYAVFDLLLTDAAVTKDEAPSLRVSLIADG